MLVTMTRNSSVRKRQAGELWGAQAAGAPDKAVLDTSAQCAGLGLDTQVYFIIR